MTPTPLQPDALQAKQLRIARLWISVFIAGLFVSGITAFPLQTELQWLVPIADRMMPAGFAAWLHRVYAALVDENVRYPFLAYGTDWLAFAHLAFAVLFFGLWRDPVRNRWLLEFAFIACAGIIPLAAIAGPIRGIPITWTLIDCSFGVFGALSLWPVYRIVRQMEQGSSCR